MLRPSHSVLIVLLASLLALGGCATTTGPDGMHRADTPDGRKNAARIHTELGQAYFKQGNLKAALGKLQTALQFDPDYMPAHTVLGTLYARLGNMAKAEQHYRRAVELKPESGAANNNFGTFLCHEDKVREGLPYIKKALADPFYKTPAVAWTNAGMCQMRIQNFKQAETNFKKALGFNSRYPDALYQMARALYLQGDAFHASAFIQRRRALGHPDAATLKLGYDIANRLGNAEGAQDYARQLRAKFPDSDQAQALNTHTSP
ncbi:MAG TPA: type IV pilus biogenesis/stability protein PilW [Oleiagrimonas sp.]|nr:type IV pilus biogenesis/stability protein PilW [Oleiagrimonas sp.]